MDMERIRLLPLLSLLLLAGPAGVFALEPQPVLGYADAEQYLPPDNDEPGFDWEGERRAREQFVYIGDNVTYLKVSQDQAADLADGTGRCLLRPNTLYPARLEPGFIAEHMSVQLAEAPGGCSFRDGYVYMSHVSSSSAGGAWELPRQVRAFLDTLAYAEGTNDRYNYIFTFVTFSGYSDHPRRKICAGRLCSTAAGRYQFLSKTWDALAADLGLEDFTPPNQEKAVLEIIRRAGAYRKVAGSANYDNFTGALKKLNTTWASLPGSPYGQPTHSTADLWRFYRRALSNY